MCRAPIGAKCLLFQYDARRCHWRNLEINPGNADDHSQFLGQTFFDDHLLQLSKSSHQQEASNDNTDIKLLCLIFFSYIL